MSEFSFHHSDPDDLSGMPTALRQLERTMQAAGEYVQPTEDLRPKVLEAARSARRQQRANRRISVLTLLVVLLTVTGLPTLLISAYPNLIATDSTEMHHRAARSVIENRTEAHFALFEVFSALREEHSEKFNQGD